jgi:uncharacterized membrane protein
MLSDNVRYKIMTLLIVMIIGLAVLFHYWPDYFHTALFLFCMMLLALLLIDMVLKSIKDGKTQSFGQGFSVNRATAPLAFWFVVTAQILLFGGLAVTMIYWLGTTNMEMGLVN